MTMRITNLLSLALFALILSACGSKDAEGMADKMMDDAKKGAETMMDDAKKGAETMMDKIGANNSGDITLSPMPNTKEFMDAAITEWTYQNGKFKYVATGYEFGAQTPDADALMCANSGKGQHAHLIVNNMPYMAKYTPEFDLELPDGNHHILTFLSRSYHESIKTAAAHRAVNVDIKNNSFAKVMDITEPMLFYSRPKGTYTGEANTKNVMLDFYPVNAPLGAGADDYHIKAVVNGTEEFDITEWKPYFLTGLPMGENTVELTLMKGSEKVDTPLNPVTREFTLEALPVEKGM